MGIKNVTNEIHGLMFNQLTPQQIIIRQYSTTVGWFEKVRGFWEFFPEEDIQPEEIIQKLIERKLSLLNKDQ